MHILGENIRLSQQQVTKVNSSQATMDAQALGRGTAIIPPGSIKGYSRHGNSKYNQPKLFSGGSLR